MKMIIALSTKNDVALVICASLKPIMLSKYSLIWPRVRLLQYTLANTIEYVCLCAFAGLTYIYIFDVISWKWATNFQFPLVNTLGGFYISFPFSIYCAIRLKLEKSLQ